MRYALLVCADESVGVSGEERARREAAFTRFLDEMRERGVLHAGEWLHRAETAATVRCWSDGHGAGGMIRHDRGEAGTGDVAAAARGLVKLAVCGAQHSPHPQHSTGRLHAACAVARHWPAKVDDQPRRWCGALTCLLADVGHLGHPTLCGQLSSHQSPRLLAGRVRGGGPRPAGPCALTGTVRVIGHLRRTHPSPHPGLTPVRPGSDRRKASRLPPGSLISHAWD
jgi:hypothetical protein